MWKLPHDRPIVRVEQKESHEAAAVVAGSVEGGKEEVAKLGWDSRHHGVLHGQRASLRDLDPFVHVDPGIPAAHDVLGRWHEEEDRKGEPDERRRHQGGPSRPRCRRAKPEPASTDRGEQRAQCAVEPEQPVIPI